MSDPVFRSSQFSAFAKAMRESGDNPGGYRIVEITRFFTPLPRCRLPIVVASLR